MKESFQQYFYLIFGALGIILGVICIGFFIYVKSLDPSNPAADIPLIRLWALPLMPLAGFYWMSRFFEIKTQRSSSVSR